MTYNVGDTVKIKKHKKRPSTWNNRGEMDWCMGQEFKIKSISGDEYELHNCARGDYDWIFTDSDFVSDFVKERYKVNEFYMERLGV